MLIHIIEYKGKHLAEEAKEKGMVGALWADSSDGQCLFEMPIAGDFSSLDKALRTRI